MNSEAFIVFRHSANHGWAKTANVGVGMSFVVLSGRDLSVTASRER
jgi:hypothetical protein